MYCTPVLVDVLIPSGEASVREPGSDPPPGVSSPFLKPDGYVAHIPHSGVHILELKLPSDSFALE